MYSVCCMHIGSTCSCTKIDAHLNGLSLKPCFGVPQLLLSVLYKYGLALS